MDEELASLRAKLAEMEKRQADYDELKERVAKFEEQMAEPAPTESNLNKTFDANKIEPTSEESEIPADLSALLETHAAIQRKNYEAISSHKRAYLKQKFSTRMLERTPLISLDPEAANEKMAKFLKVLDKKCEKSRLKELRYGAQIKQSSEKIEAKFAALESSSSCAAKWMVRALRSEVDLSDLRAQVIQLTDMFALAYEEQSRSESLICECLRQLKSKHIMLASHGNYPEENKAFQVGKTIYGALLTRFL